MAKGDEFVYGLVGGLAILAALLLIFNVSYSSFGSGYATSTNWFAPSGTQPELVLADMAAARETGKVVSNAVSDIDLGNFYVSGIIEENELPGGVVQSGLLFGDSSLKYLVENPKFLRFTVTRMNGYGNLIIKVNGQVLQDTMFGLGESIVPINVIGNAKVDVYAANSGWKMWAPTLYELTDVELGSVNPKSEYSFASGEDFVRGELRVTAEEGQGIMRVNLNGETLWSGMLNDANWKVVQFDRTNELNSLVLEASPGSSFEGNAKLVLYHTHVDYEPYVTFFNLTSEQLNKLPGHITFEVPSVQNSGTIVVKLMVGDQTKYVEMVDAKVGAQAVAFYKNNVVPGETMRLVIESPDALFSLRNVKIWV